MATKAIICGSCGKGVAADIIAGEDSWRSVAWLRCPLCEEGSVKLSRGAVYPVAPAGGTVLHLPDDVEAAWREARTTHAVAAYTASEMMCRKILMHVAVDVAGSSPGRKFFEYVNDLETAGYITTGLKPVVDKVRDRGNIANHELPASNEQDSLRTIEITEHLLRSVYELPSLP